MTIDMRDHERLTIASLTERCTVTVPEAAAVLGISADNGYAAAKTGELPTLKFGRRLLVPVPKLLALIGYEPNI